MRKWVGNASYLLAGEAGSRLFGFLTTALLARRLGVEAFGQIGFAAAMMAYGMVLTDIGLTTVGARSVAQDGSRTAPMLGAMLPLRLLLALTAGAAMALVAVVLPKSATVKWLLVLYAAAVVVQSTLLEWLFIGMEKMGLVALARVLTTGANFGLVLLLVRRSQDVLLAPVALGVATALGSATLFVAYVSRFGLPRLRGSRDEWRGLLKPAWPIGLSSMLTQLHVNLGLVLLGLLATFAQAGLYSSAYRMVFLLLTLDRVFYTVFFPVVSRFMKHHPERLPDLVGSAGRVVLALCIPFCAGALVLAQPILELVFGAGYAPASALLCILVWFLPLSMLNSLAGYTLLAAGREREFLANTALAVGAAVLLNLAAIHLAGPAGAASAIVAGEAMLLVMMSRSLLRVVKPRWEWRVFAPVVAALAMTIVLVLLPDLNLFGRIGFGVLTYSVLLLRLKGLTAGDIGLAKTA